MQKHPIKKKKKHTQVINFLYFILMLCLIFTLVSIGNDMIFTMSLILDVVFGLLICMLEVYEL